MRGSRRGPADDLVPVILFHECSKVFQLVKHAGQGRSRLEQYHGKPSPGQGSRRRRTKSSGYGWVRVEHETTGEVWFVWCSSSISLGVGTVERPLTCDDAKYLDVE